MRKRLLASLGALLTGTSLALSQAPAPPVMSEKIAAPAEKTDGFVVPMIPHADSTSTLAGDDYHGSVTDGCGKGCGPHVWGSAESLLWWLKSAPVPVPLLSTFAPGTPSAAISAKFFGGALGVPGTIVMTPDHLGYGPFLGGRLTVGGWLDSEQQFGVEGSGFLLETRTASSGALSNAAGNPPLRALFCNPPPGAGFPLGESSFVLSDPGFASGGQTISSSTRLWGAEANGLFRAVNNDMLSLSLLGGFRYLDLQERLTIADYETLLTGGFGSFSTLDAFGTRNQFYGGQLGAKAEAHYEHFFASLVGKVALGVDHESVTINGVTSVTPVGGPTTISGGGIYAQGTNIGRLTRDQFAVVPSAQLQVGMDITCNIRAFVGYDVLYVSAVARPGDQIDRVINFTQSAAVNGVLTAPPLIGQPRPAALINSTDFWANGISAGLQFSF